MPPALRLPNLEATPLGLQPLDGERAAAPVLEAPLGPLKVQRVTHLYRAWGLGFGRSAVNEYFFEGLMVEGLRVEGLKG